MKITTYLFDLDDTLIDTKIYAELYKPLLNQIKKKLNLSNEELETKAKELGLKKNRHGRWDTGDLCRELKLLDLYYKELERKIKVISVLHEGVEEVFKKLKEKGKRIGIISNSMQRTIKLYVDEYALSKYVDFIFSRDEAGCRKSEKRYWTRLIEKENLNPAEGLTIGDNLKEDVEIPKELGFKTVQIKNPADLKSVLDR